MKKRLFLMLTLAMGAVGAFAQTYYYTFDGRYKVEADAQNLFSNGDFADGTTNGFTNVYGQPVSGDTIAVFAGEGPNGGNCARVLLSSDRGNPAADDQLASLNATANMYRSVYVTAGNYLFTYKIKSGSGTGQTNVGTANYTRAANYQTVYTNTTGDFEVPGISSANNYGNYVTYGPDEWLEINYYVNMAEDGYISWLNFNSRVGDMFADFGLYQCTPVADDRDVQDIIDEYEYYLSIDGFENGREDMETVIMPYLYECLTLEEEDVVSGYLDEILGGDYVQEFLTSNAADVSSYFSNFSFDNGSSGWSGSGWSRETSAWSNFTTGYMSTNSTASYVLGGATYQQTATLAGGNYLYVVQASAYRHFMDGSGSSNNQRIPDYYNQIDGLYMFINGDTLRMTDVPTYRGKKYFLYVHDVPAGEITIGFHTNGSNGVREGGYHRFDNIRIFNVGSTLEQIEQEAFDAQKELLNEAISSAQDMVNSSRYMFGKAVLQDSVNVATNVMNSTQCDVEGVGRGILRTQTTYMRNAISAFETLNLEYTTLGDDITEANDLITNRTDYTNGRTDFQTAITQAQNVYNAVTAENRDSLTLVQADSALVSAQNLFLTLNASYNEYVELPLTNNSFQQGNSNGWIQDGKTGNDRWRFQGYNEYSEYYCIHYDRGSSAADEKWVYQEVPIHRPGVYMFTAECLGHNGTQAVVSPNTDLYIFAASGADYVAGDSTMVSTLGSGVSQTRGPEIGRFSVRHVVTEENFAGSNGTIRVGMYKFATSNATVFEMSGCHLYYYGDYESYLQDSILAVLAPTRDSLQRAIDAANTLYGEARNTAGIDNSAFTSAIATAQGVVNNQSATLDEILAQFPLLEAAEQNFMVSGVWPAEGKYYDLSFLIKNPTFQGATAAEDGTYTCEGWDIVGRGAILAGATESGYVCYYNTVTSPLNMEATSITQSVTGLPAGQYQFHINATYRYGLAATWDPETYVDATYMYAVANDQQVAVNGLLAEGQLMASNDQYWQYDQNGAVFMSLYDYRHTPGMEIVFNAGYFGTDVPFTIAAGEAANVGVSTEGLRATSYVIFQNPTLRFWGDAIVDGIEQIGADVEGNLNAAGDIYSVSGIKVRSNATSFNGLSKGIYIKNGKKVVVK